MSAPIEWAILLPLAGAAACFLTKGRIAVATAAVSAAATLATAVLIAWSVWQDGPQSMALGGWLPPLGIGLYVDGLSALLLLLTATIMTVTGVYASAYFRGESEAGGWHNRDGFLPLWLFLYAALNGLFLSGDLFNLYVLLELVTLAGVGLVILAGGREALTAAMRYLLAAFLGSLFFLLGVALIYGTFHTLDLQLLQQRLEVDRLTALALAVMTIGLMIKTALFPFHAWLPRAHASAPAPVSAMLSALVVKASFYVILRLWVDVFGGDIAMGAGQAVGVLGAAGVLWGSVQALREERLKLVVAHSTVAQVGYLFILIPLVTASGGAEAAAWRMDAWSGGVYHILSHAFAKAALFLSAGTVALVYAGDKLSDIRGLARHLPLTAATFGIAGIALVGLPPSGSFVAKWLMLGAAIGHEQWWWVVAIGAGTLLSGAYVFRIMREAFTDSEAPAGFRKPPPVLELAALVLALAALTLGLRGVEALTMMEIGASPFLGEGEP